jgi:hypothetical protein
MAHELGCRGSCRELDFVDDLEQDGRVVWVENDSSSYGSWSVD